MTHQSWSRTIMDHDLYSPILMPLHGHALTRIKQILKLFDILGRKATITFMIHVLLFSLTNETFRPKEVTPKSCILETVSKSKIWEFNLKKFSSIMDHHGRIDIFIFFSNLRPKLRCKTKTNNPKICIRNKRCLWENKWCVGSWLKTKVLRRFVNDHGQAHVARGPS